MTFTRSRIRPVSRQRAKARASADGRAGLAHMARVKQLRCVVCHHAGPSDVHHVIHDRYGSRRASDLQVISLCEQCHRYPHSEAIHTDKAAWRERNGADYEYLPVIADMLAGELSE